MTERSRLRIVVLGVLVVSLVATLLGRLWYLQVMAAPQFNAVVQQQGTREVATQPPRGEILDDKGRPLVDNKPALVVSVDRTTLAKQPDDGKAVLERLSGVLHVPYTKLNRETTPCVYVKHHVVRKGKPTIIYGLKVNPCWSGLPYQPVPVSQRRPSLRATERALQIQETPEQFPGISVALSAVRNYPKPDGALASSMLGYIAPISSAALKKLSVEQQNVQRDSEVGVTGLEASYQKYLGGTPGVKEVSVDHIGNITGVVKNTAPKPGDDVVTNIDAKAQADLEQQLRNAISYSRNNGNWSAPYAAGVVMNVRTGGVIAMASDPTYPPSAFVPSISGKEYAKLRNERGTPLYDKAYQSAQPPGSTFKMISSAGLLYDGMITPGGEYDCPTYSDKGGQIRHSFEAVPGLGNIPLMTAIEQSCDTFFFNLGYDDWYRDYHLIQNGHKPREGVQHIARVLGLGENPGIDLPNATYGHIPDRKNTKLDWQQLHPAYCQGAKNPAFSAVHRADDEDYCKYGDIFEPGDQENEDVGQGTVTASPLQMAVAYSALANGGTVFEPRVAKAILSPTGKLIKRIKAPVRDHIPLSKADLDYLRSCFYTVTQDPKGTAYSAFSGFPWSQVSVAGKTGTAELPNTNQNDSWFISFGGPAGHKPQFVAVIEVYKSNQGAISAAPFVRNMWDDLYGFRGAKAIFKNGVPPTKLPTIKAQPTAKSHKHKSSSHGATTGGTAPAGTTSGTSPPSTDTSALGLPPSLGVQFERRRGGGP